MSLFVRKPLLKPGMLFNCFLKPRTEVYCIIEVVLSMKMKPWLVPYVKGNLEFEKEKLDLCLLNEHHY